MAHPFQARRQTKVEHDRVKHIAKGYASGGAVTAPDVPAKRASGGAVRAAITGKKSGGRVDRIPRKSGGRIKRAEGGSTPSKPAEPKPVPIQPGTPEWLEGRIGRRQGRARGGRTNSKKGTTNVNVIIAPQGGDKMPGLAGQMPGGPPMMPPKPPMPMMPPPGGAPGMPPGGPPPSIRHDGGRAYASGGAVKSGPAWEEGKRNGTQVSHSPNKMDGKDIGRPKPVTYASGGPVEAPRKGGMGPKLRGGARGGIARLEKERRI